MQEVLSDTSSRLYGVLGDFHMSTDSLVQNFYKFSDFYPCYTGTKLAYDITVTESLPLQLGFERFQYIRLNLI